jgi:DNA-binding MarR family transcriptional regulator
MTSEGDETAAGDLLAAVLTFAEHGLPVFPVKPRSKVPATVDGFKSATVDLDQLRAWWKRWPDANIGIPTGAVSGFVVLDVDARHGGVASFEKLRDRHRLPRTAQVLTGSGGFHYWYRHTGELRNSAGLLGDGLDVRGDGGYVIAPPSVHESGNPYKWLQPLEDAIDWPQVLAADVGKRRNGTAAKFDEVIPEGKRRAAMLTVAGKLKRSGLTGSEILPSLRELNKRCRPPLDERELESVAYESSIEPEQPLGKPAYTGPARALGEVVAAFESWLYLPDSTIVLVALGTVAANLLEGSPLWMLLVAPPGGGKTETLGAISSLPDVYPTAVLTEASLLSGSPNRDRAQGAKGGLLRELGDFGIVVAKDFGSVLSMRQDGRAAVLAALREVFDGSWTRHVGTDGGKTLSWSGKVGLLAGCTPTIDRHHAVMAQMGERFVLYRHQPGDRREQALSTLRHSGKREKAMRTELAASVRGLLANGLPREPRELSEEEAEQIAALASFVATCRSAVERDAYSREIELVPGEEAPTRLAGELERLLAGLDALGLERDRALNVVGRVARDSMPALRAELLDILSATGPPIKTTAIAEEAGYPSSTTRRSLEDLTAHGVVTRYPQGEGKADLWSLTDTAKTELMNLSRFSFFYTERDLYE